MTLFRNRIAFLMALSRIRNIVVYGVPPLTLNNAVAGSLGSLIAYGGTYQGVPSGYMPYNYISNNSALIDTGIYDDVDDVVYEILVEAQSTTAFYIFSSRETTSSSQYGISGSGSANKTITFMNNTLTSSIRRESGKTYYIRASHINGVSRLYVKNITDNVDDTQTGTYTWGTPAPTPINLFGNGVQTVGTHYIKYARMWKSRKLVMDYVPASYNGTAGFYDRVSNTFKTQSTGSLTAGAVQYPAPTAPADIVCNNGVVKVSPNLYNMVSNPIEQGTLGANSDYRVRTSDYISVVTGNTYTVSTNVEYMYVWGFYSDNTNISISSNWVAGSGYTFTVPSNIVKLKLVFAKSTDNTQAIVPSDVSWVMLEKGSTATPYMPYGYYADGNTETLSIWQVPAGYKQLEYIEGTGTQYIDTGIKPNQNTSVEIKYNLTELIHSSTSPSMLFGSRQSAMGTNASNGIFRTLTWTINKAAFGNGEGTNELLSGTTGQETDTDYVLKFNKNAVYYDDVLQLTIPNVTPTWSSLVNIYLFAVNTNGTSQYPCKAKFYYTKIWDGETLVRNFIPALEISTGDVGMYDMVSGTFFTSSGSGDFIAGPLANTVVCEPLFGGEPYGTDPEEQNILTGEVTRWYKVMVLDGSENWSGDASDNPKDDGWILNVNDYNVPASRDVRFWCTHFFHIAIFPASNPEGRCCGYATNQLWFGAAQMCPTLASWKAWLKQQSETRNPVIIVYYSANSSTEQVAAQSINVEAGSNTLDFVETAITDLKVKATYTRE